MSRGVSFVNLLSPENYYRLDQFDQKLLCDRVTKRDLSTINFGRHNPRFRAVVNDLTFLVQRKPRFSQETKKVTLLIRDPHDPNSGARANRCQRNGSLGMASHCAIR